MHVVASKSARNPWLIRPRAVAQPRLRLFCFPHSGGAGSQFLAWSAALPPDIDVCGVQLPGRQQRFIERPFATIPPLLDQLTRVLEPYTDVPFALFGHSLGGFIIFELARALRRIARPEPAYLFVAAARAPHLPSRLPELHRLPDADFLDGLRRYQGTPDEALRHAELMELLLPTLRADFSLTETYRYAQEPPLDAPISVFGGLDDPVVEREELAPWRQHTRGAFSLRLMAGDHFFVHSARSALLAGMMDDLETTFQLGTPLRP